MELAAMMGHKRPRDLRNRQGKYLAAAGVVECFGDYVRLTADWLEALNRMREQDWEIADHRRDMAEYERQRDAWASLEDGLSLVLPRMVARLAVNEPRLFVSLFRWALRRVGLEENEFGYHERSLMRALVPMIIVTSPVELLFVHLLAHAFSPWEWVKWALLVLEVYAVLWMLGLYASLVTLPYRLEEKGLRLCYGAFVQGFVPYEEIEETVRVTRRAPGFGDGLWHVSGEDALYLATGGRTDITLRLQTPRSVNGFLKERAPARTFHLAANDPGRLARELRRRVEEGATGLRPVE